MGRRNQTEVAILGGLSVSPMTGYRLREQIRGVLGHFWSESYGQIYPTLERLERGGFVARGASSRAGSTFRLTRTGATRLRELLAQPIQPQPPRNGLLLRLFFGRHLGPSACRDLVVAAKADACQRLEMFAAIRQEIAEEAAAGEDATYWLLTVAAGEHTARSAIEWADESLEALDRLERPGRSRG